MADRLLAHFKSNTPLAGRQIWQRKDHSIYLLPDNRELTKEEFQKIYQAGYLDLDVESQPAPAPTPPIAVVPPLLPPSNPVALPTPANANSTIVPALENTQPSNEKPKKKRKIWRLGCAVMILLFLFSCCSIPTFIGINLIKSKNLNPNDRALSKFLQQKDKSAAKDTLGLSMPTPEEIGLEKDSDGDGLSNGDEIKLKTDFTNPDSDGDGISDGSEVSKYHTDPRKYSSSGDGVADGVKIKYKLDPRKNAAKLSSPKKQEISRNAAVSPDVNSLLLGSASAAPKALETSSSASSEIIKVNKFSGKVQLRYSPSEEEKSQLPKGTVAPPLSIVSYSPLDSKIVRYSTKFDAKTGWASAAVAPDRKIENGYMFLATDGQVRGLEMKRDMEGLLTFSEGDEVFFVMLNTFGVDGYFSHIQIYKVTKEFHLNKQKVSETYDVGPIYLLGKELHPKIEVTYSELSEMEYGVFNFTLGKVFTQSVNAGVKNLSEGDPDNVVFKGETARKNFAEAVMHLVLYWDRFRYVSGEPTSITSSKNSSEATATAPTEKLPSNWTGTGFRPWKDAWRFPNFRSEFAKDGNCAGLSTTAVLRYRGQSWASSGSADAYTRAFPAVKMKLDTNTKLLGNSVRGYYPTDSDWLDYYARRNSALSYSNLKDTPTDWEALSFFGYYSNISNSTMNRQPRSFSIDGTELDKIKAQLRQGIPLLAGINNSIGGHQLVAYGMEENHNGDPDWTIIYLYDCNKPDQKCQLYVYRNTYKWYDAVYNQRAGDSCEYKLFYQPWGSYVDTALFFRADGTHSYKYITTLR